MDRYWTNLLASSDPDVLRHLNDDPTYKHAVVRGYALLEQERLDEMDDSQLSHVMSTGVLETYCDSRGIDIEPYWERVQRYRNEHPPKQAS